MVFLLVIILPGDTNIRIDIVHQAVHTERKVVLEESDTIEFILKEHNCGKTITRKEKNVMEVNFQDAFSEYLG